MAALREALGSVVEDTLANVEKKQARTYEELQAEQAEADEVRPAPLRCGAERLFLTRCRVHGIGFSPRICEPRAMPALPRRPWVSTG